MDASFILIALALVMTLGSILIRLLNKKTLLFAFNCLMLILLLAGFAYFYYSGIGTPPELIVNTFAINPFSIFFGAMFTAGMLLVNMLAEKYSENYGDFAIISNFALLGMYVVSSSVSLITIFVGLELATLPAVFLILLSRGTIEAATKLFITAAIAIAILSFAIVLLYGASNSFALKSYSQSTIIAFAALLFVAALGFEASIFPFNVLIPDIYTGSSAYVTAMLGGVNKKVGFAALLQVLLLVFITNKELFLFVAVLSTLTMFYGNIVALLQNNTKRMLAYSSISQAGYILIGVAVASQAGITAAIFQIFSHMFIFIGMLGILAFLESKNRKEVNDLIGLSGENSLAAFSLSLFMLSLIGLPLTTGFVGKFLLFLSAINAGLIWLAVIGIINTAISVFYYVKAIMAMYANKEGARHLSMPLSLRFVVIICILITVIFGIYPGPLVNLASGAATYLIPK
ncbi:MAG: hypothetical protein KGH64_05405 [Candidatus Micrarchaeota archaeon]|nr:hypothetical protein [Candidatus Micrarchaeota archaeon]MDE1834745.1 hypothetical protein [Candidatus Micrarchaeota archaeon]MDE1859369.1 hypothetical protein [Candidatus Micrarchaeota archaeon]